MSASTAAPVRIELRPLLRRHGPLLALCGATLLLGIAGQPIARPLFLLGCIAVSWDLMRFGGSAHLAGAFALFCLAPFLRRVVDLHAGYEPAGLMIAGPLLAIAVPAPWLLFSLARARRFDPALRPFLLGFACALYGVLLTVVDGNFTQAASNAVKWLAPVLYGMWLYDQAGPEADVLAAPTRMAMVLMPLLGLYGLLQYVDPPAWDQYWMNYTTIASIGRPEPYEVRVFSTMNAPAGYASFTAAALLMFGFRRPRPWLLLVAGPSLLGLLLTSYRTAWVALVVGVVIGLFHRPTRGRAGAALLAIPLLAIPVLTLTPAGDAIWSRLETVGNLGGDYSAQERLGEYSVLLDHDSGTLIGHGFENLDVLQAGTVALDGLLVVAWNAMGLVVGMLAVAAAIWAGLQAMRAAWRGVSLTGLAVTGIMAGLLAQIPLSTISASEIGFLFWSIAGIGAAVRPTRGPGT